MVDGVDYLVNMSILGTAVRIILHTTGAGERKIYMNGYMNREHEIMNTDLVRGQGR